MPEVSSFELVLNWPRFIIYGQLEYGMTSLCITADDIKELCPIPLYGPEKDSRWQREEGAGAGD